MSAKAPAKGHTRKHTGTHKHGAHHAKHNPQHHRKGHEQHGHHVTTKAHHAHHAKGRGWALSGDLLPVCSLEAVAMSLRLAGQPVHDDEVAWLWELAGGRELSIPEALQAAVEFGLAGWRPLGLRRPLAVADGSADQGYTKTRRPAGTRTPLPTAEVGVLPTSGLILGINRPGPHAVLATPDGWWSWGQLYSPWPSAIEEAWLIGWGDAR